MADDHSDQAMAQAEYDKAWIAAYAQQTNVTTEPVDRAQPPQDKPLSPQIHPNRMEFIRRAPLPLESNAQKPFSEYVVNRLSTLGTERVAQNSPTPVPRSSLGFAGFQPGQQAFTGFQPGQKVFSSSYQSPQGDFAPFRASSTVDSQARLYQGVAPFGRDSMIPQSREPPSFGRESYTPQGYPAPLSGYPPGAPQGQRLFSSIPGLSKTQPLKRKASEMLGNEAADEEPLEHVNPNKKRKNPKAQKQASNQPGTYNGNTAAIDQSVVQRLIQEAQSFDMSASVAIAIDPTNIPKKQRAALKLAGESLKRLLASHQNELQTALSTLRVTANVAHKNLEHDNEQLRTTVQDLGNKLSREFQLNRDLKANKSTHNHDELNAQLVLLQKITEEQVVTVNFSTKMAAKQNARAEAAEKLAAEKQDRILRYEQQIDLLDKRLLEIAEAPPGSDLRSMIVCDPAQHVSKETVQELEQKLELALQRAESAEDAVKSVKATINSAKAIAEEQQKFLQHATAGMVSAANLPVL